MKNILTIEKLTKLSKEKLDTVKCLCWKNGKKRCKTIGIRDISIEYIENSDRIKLSWSDDAGDPIIFAEYDEEIDRISQDNYEYTLISS